MAGRVTFEKSRIITFSSLSEKEKESYMDFLVDNDVQVRRGAEAGCVQAVGGSRARGSTAARVGAHGPGTRLGGHVCVCTWVWVHDWLTLLPLPPAPAAVFQREGRQLRRQHPAVHRRAGRKQRGQG